MQRQIISTPILSPFYPTASDVAGGYAHQLHFGQPTRWWDSPEEFREKVKQPGFEKFGQSAEIIEKWKSHSNFIPFIKWAATAIGSDRLPDVLGGCILREPLGESEVETVHLILYFPNLNTNKQNHD
jgi:hypothetical protein